MWITVPSVDGGEPCVHVQCMCSHTVINGMSIIQTFLLVKLQLYEQRELKYMCTYANAVYFLQVLEAQDRLATFEMAFGIENFRSVCICGHVYSCYWSRVQSN